MKIALIGTSPIMLLLALKLAKKNNVTIYENLNKFGGAWSYAKLKEQLIPAQTNVIIPQNKMEQTKIKKINNFMLKNYDVGVNEVKKFTFMQGYKPKSIFIYDLIKLYNVIKTKNITIVKKKYKFFFD